MTPRARRLVAALLGLVAAAMLVRSAWSHAAWLRDGLLFVNDNTIRDFEVYGQPRHGRLPLQGPVTSIGSNHGWVAYWLYGLPLVPWPRLETLYVVTALAIGVTWASGVAVARAVSGRLPALVAALVLPATYVPFLLYFPNHIAWVLPGTALAFLGTLHARERGSWALLTTTGLMLALGAHRIGYVVTAAFVVLDWRLGLGVFRWKRAWVPLVAFLAPEVVTQLLGGSPTPYTSALARHWMSDVDPWLVARQLPFATVPIRPFSAVQGAQMAWVVAAAVLARGATTHPTGKAVWWFYVVGAVGMLAVHHDTQYYFPMLAVLPVMAAMATWAALARGRAAAYGWLVATTVVLVASHDEVTARTLAPDLAGAQGLHGVRDELAMVEALGAAGISGPELWTRTGYVAPGLGPPIGYLAEAFLPLPDEAPTPSRCFLIALGRPEPTGEGWTRVGPTQALRIGTDEACPVTPLQRVVSPIWYVDLPRGRFVRR